MRDHLLGCHQFQAAESSDDYEHYGCGVPRRVAWAPTKIEDTSAADFEAGDHTLKSMRKDFPHEYDLRTMYGDAARRSYQDSRNAWMRAEMERVCGAPKAIGVDYGRGDDTAVAIGVDYGRGDDTAVAIVYAVAPHAKAAAEYEWEARRLQALRYGRNPLALDL